MEVVEIKISQYCKKVGRSLQAANTAPYSQLISISGNPGPERSSGTFGCDPLVPVRERPYSTAAYPQNVCSVRGAADGS